MSEPRRKGLKNKRYPAKLHKFHLGNLYQGHRPGSKSHHFIGILVDHYYTLNFAYPGHKGFRNYAWVLEGSSGERRSFQLITKVMYREPVKPADLLAAVGGTR